MTYDIKEILLGPEKEKYISEIKFRENIKLCKTDLELKI